MENEMMVKKKSIYITPKCVSAEMKEDLLLTTSSDEVPVLPDEPAIPAAREEHRRDINIWDQGW